MAKESNTCRVPNEIAHHSQGEGNTKSVKGDRGYFLLAQTVLMTSERI